ncbi:MAG: flippase [Terracidiphilus sp.]|jgi:O-antigen/teichoic acid export membrane protein
MEEWQRLTQSSLARNAGWMMVGQGAGVILQAAYFIVLARLLGAVQYGVFAGAFAFTNIAAQYSALGTGTVLLRYVSGDRNNFAVYWGNILLATLGVGAVLVLVLHILAPYVLNRASASLVIFAGIANCISAQLATETGRVFQAFEKMRMTATLNLLTNVLRTVVAVGMLLLLHHSTAWQWALASMVVSAISATVAIALVTQHFGNPRFALRVFWRFGPEGFGYSFASSTASVYNDIDKTMLSHYGMNLATGVYTMAYRVIDIATIPITAIRDAAMPRLFKRGREGIASTAELSYQMLRRALPLSVLVGAGIFLSASLIPLILGNGFAESATALRWLSLIPLFRSVHQMTGSALLGAGLQRYRTSAQLIAAAFNFGVNLWLIPHFGWLGAAWSSLATDGLLGALNWGILRFLILRERNSLLSSPGLIR